MGNRAEQLATFGQIAADAFAHGVERAPHFNHFAATTFGHRLDVGAQRQIPRRPRQTLERSALPVHQQADEQQQETAGENDEPHLLRRQALLFKTGVRLGQQRGDIQPFARCHLNLRDQHGRVHRFQGQRVVRPGAWQLIELQAGVENPQILGTYEGHRNISVVTQGLSQHFVHRFHHRSLARGDRQDFHSERFVVERHHEPRAAHAAQLVEHQRSIGHRQRTKVTDAGRHRMRQAAGAGDQSFELCRTQLRHPDHARQRLGEQHCKQGQQQHAAEQRARHRHPFCEFAQGLSDHCWQSHWLPIDNRCRVRCESVAAVFPCRANADADD
ncbi:hypothetical protein D3C87_1317390 [compost metagenome]